MSRLVVLGLVLLVLFAALVESHDGVAAQSLRRAQRVSKKKGIVVPPDETAEEASKGRPAHLKMVSGQMKAHLDAWLSDVLSDKFDDDPKKCAEETDAMMKELRYAYTRRLVPSVLRDECKHFLYYERFGSDEEVCYAIVEHLVNTWKGDKDYETWCKDVYSKRHTAKDASEIPKKEDPGPRKGKYADVEEFSYPNDADPEKPCHGSPDCGSGKGSTKDDLSPLAKDESPKPRKKTEAKSGAAKQLQQGILAWASAILIGGYHIIIMAQ